AEKLRRQTEPLGGVLVDAATVAGELRYSRATVYARAAELRCRPGLATAAEHGGPVGWCATRARGDGTCRTFGHGASRLSRTAVGAGRLSPNVARRTARVSAAAADAQAELSDTRIPMTSTTKETFMNATNNLGPMAFADALANVRGV